MPIKNNTQVCGHTGNDKQLQFFLANSNCNTQRIPFSDKLRMWKKKSVLELMTYRKLWTARKREEHYDNEKNTVLESDKLGFKSQSHHCLCDLGHIT